MNGFALTLLVILAAEAVRSQGPPTQTKKGTRPGRPNDNTDRGLPSGADVPDGTRFAPAAPTQTRSGPPPAGRPAAGPPPPAGAALPAPGRPVLPAAGGPPPPAGAPVLSGPPPPSRRPAAPGGRPNDNTDRGLPSGADVPDGTRFPAAPAAPAAPPAFFNYLAPVAPAVPAITCQDICGMTASYKPVCSIYGNQYDNDCLRECTGEPRQCENPCPCNASPVDTPIVSVSECALCPQDWDPVCIDNEETLQNECHARCQGKTITCSSSCPC